MPPPTCVLVQPSLLKCSPRCAYCGSNRPRARHLLGTLRCRCGLPLSIARDSVFAVQHRAMWLMCSTCKAEVATATCWLCSVEAPIRQWWPQEAVADLATQCGHDDEEELAAAHGSPTPILPPPTPTRASVASSDSPSWLCVIGGAVGPGSLHGVTLFDPFSGACLPWPCLNIARERLGAALLNNCIYVAGGRSTLTGARLASFELLDLSAPAPHEWKSLPDMIEARSSCCLTALPHLQQLLVSGGHNGSANLSSTEVTHVDRGPPAWAPSVPLPEALSGHTVVFNNGLISIGSVTSKAADMSGYTLRGSSWTRLSTDEPIRLGSAVVCLGSHVYVAGGYDPRDEQDNALDNLSRYDTVAGTWEALAPMPTPRHAARAVVVDGTIIVMGGVSATNVRQSVVEQYSPTSNTWTRLRPFQSPISHFGLVVLSAAVIPKPLLQPVAMPS